MRAHKALLRALTAVLVLLALSSGAAADTQRFTVIIGGRKVGHLVAHTGAQTTVDYDYKNNGRGPTTAEIIRLDAEGLPVAWSVSGRTTFGSGIAERFTRNGSRAEWVDSTGGATAVLKEPSLYVAQGGSPWADGVYARALLRSRGRELAVLPDGRLRLEGGDSLTLRSTSGAIKLTRYDLVGINLTPETLLLDGSSSLFAVVSPNFILVRSGYEGEERRLRELAVGWSVRRLAGIERSVAHHYAGPVRIHNVRLFDPETSSLTIPVSVVVQGKEIAAVEPLDSLPTPGETTIEGASGTLLAGMYEMHAHLNQDDQSEALLNLVAGTTTVRDMGNDNETLDRLIQRIEDGTLGGPHVVRSGLIEGKSPFSSSLGILVDSQRQAVDAVRWYGARGYWQIKIYSSISPDWVPAMAEQAHLLGMRVAGHVPAFTTTEQMIKAGYDEITHANLFMLSWVLQPEEDTRTLLRLTAMTRFPSLDLESVEVQHTIGMMADRHLAIDPTLAVAEALTRTRDGQIPPGAVDYFSHMPIGWRRNAMKAWIDTASPGDDQAYRAAFDKIVETVRLLHDRGVFIVFGTDLGGSFAYHRELELYQRIGMTPAQILKRATFDSARYLAQDQIMGSVEKGKLADFFLVPGDPTKDLKAIKNISMVAMDGTFYYPNEVYPHFGILPFASAPNIVHGDHPTQQPPLMLHGHSSRPVPKSGAPDSSQ